VTKKFHARPLVGEKYRHNIQKEIYIVERVREGSVDLRVEGSGTQTWFMKPFMALVDAGMIDLVESKHRGTLA
jgi:hypothetical protein